MDILPSGNIFRELQDIQDFGYFSSQSSIEDQWQQASARTSEKTFDINTNFAQFFLRSYSHKSQQRLETHKTSSFIRIGELKKLPLDEGIQYFLCSALCAPGANLQNLMKSYRALCFSPHRIDPPAARA